MLYFNTLPKILTNDNKNNAIVLTNLLARAELVQNLMTNPLMFYEYNSAFFLCLVNGFYFIWLWRISQ